MFRVRSADQKRSYTFQMQKNAAQPATTSETSPPEQVQKCKSHKSEGFSLTPSQCESGKGQELVALLSEITREGLVSKDGVPAVEHMLDVNSRWRTFLPSVFWRNIPERLGEHTTQKHLKSTLPSSASCQRQSVRES